MKPYALMDLHCDTLTGCGRPDCFGLDTLDDSTQVLSLSALPQEVHWGQCYAIFLPDQLRGSSAAAFYHQNHQNFCRQMAKFSHRVTPCRTSPDMQAAWAQGKTAAFLTVENGSALAGDLERISLLARDGVRAMTLVWNGENELGSGHSTEHGLSAFGRNAIPMLEQYKIWIDVSHLNDVGFYDLLDVAEKPFLATHSNARSICENKRNLTDDMIRKMVKRGCLIGLNYYTRFLRDDGQSPSPEDLFRHIAHFFQLGAGSLLALGSDFDGADLPDWLNTPGKVLSLYQFLQDRGLSRTEVDGIFFQNALRFWDSNS